MSNNGDLKQEGPPTLFHSQPETDEAGHTRILASLEGRVGANCKASKKSRRRYGVAAAIVLLLAGVGTWIALNQDGDPALLPVAEHAAPATQATHTPATEPAHTAAVAPTPAAPATSTTTATTPAEPPQAATIVNVTPTDEHASDKAGKDAAPEKSVASTLDKNEQVVTVKSGNTEAAKAETAKLVAKSTDTSIKPAQTKAKPQSAQKSAKSRKGGLTADDPDADLLAALLSPQNANKPANQPKGQ